MARGRERRAVGHAEDGNLLSGGLGDIDGVDDAGCRVEVEYRVEDTCPSAGSALLPCVHEQHVVVGTVHGVYPQAVGIFEVVVDFASREVHGVEHVLVLVEVEHVADVDVAIADLGIVGQRRSHGDVGTGDGELQRVDEVDKSRGAEVGIAGGDGLRHRAYAPRHEAVDGGILPCEACHEVGTHVEVVDGRDLSADVLRCHAAVADGACNPDIGNGVCGVGGVEHQYGVARRCGCPHVGAHVVVAAQDDVEARDTLCHLHGSVFAVLAAQPLCLGAGVEQAYHDVGLLLVEQYGHPAACGLLHVVEAQSLPQVGAEPHGDGGGYHAENGHAHAVALEDGVGLEVRLAGGGVDDVGTEHGIAAVGGPAVEDAAAGLHVVVAHVACHAAHEVEHVGGNVYRRGVDEVVVVCRRLSLQDVAVVDQEEVVAILLPELPHVGVHTCQAATDGTAAVEVEGIETSVYVARLEHTQFHGALLYVSGRHRHHEKQCRQDNGEYSFHVVAVSVSETGASARCTAVMPRSRSRRRS